MGPLQKHRLSHAINSLIASSDEESSITSATILVRELGAAAVPQLLANLRRDKYGTLTTLLSEVVTSANLPLLINDGLLNQDHLVAAQVRNALRQAKRVDINRLLELYLAGGGDIVDISDLLVCRRAELNAKSLLRILELATSTADLGLFNLIDELSTEAIVIPLIGFLKKLEWGRRAQIARIIARFPSAHVRDALLQLLKDPHRIVREAALEGIAALGLPVPVEEVCTLLRDPDLPVQAKAIDTLIKLNDPQCIKLLLAVLKDESEHARRGAVEVLNSLANASAIHDLIAALKDADWWVRVRAADALGAIGGAKVIDGALRLLSDDDEFVRRTAIEIINSSKDKRALDYLLKALNDADWWVRERALDALASLGDKRATPYLIAMLAGEDATTPAVIRALSQLGDSRAFEPIIAKLGSLDASIQGEAVAALALLAPGESAPKLTGCLQQFRPLTPEIQRSVAALEKKLANYADAASGNSARPAHSASAEFAITAALNQPSAQRSGVDADLQQQATRVIRNSKERINHSQAESLNAAPSTAGRMDLSNIRPGTVIAERYLVRGEIGRGAFGTVLRASDQVIGEEIALKIINPELVQDEEHVTRFLHEVRYSRKVTHENVIRVYDFIRLDGLYGISMEYFLSRALSEHVRKGMRLHPARALKLVKAITRGIRSAHRVGVMHRDLKPANILVNDNDVLKIVDFGLAAVSSHAGSRLTQTGTLIGTPYYMSPEQGQGLALDHRTDIYSLGVIMYEMFTGSLPYVANNPLTVLYMHARGEKDPPSARNPEILQSLEAVVLKAMAVKPENRYQSADELLGALTEVNVPAPA